MKKGLENLVNRFAQFLDVFIFNLKSKFYHSISDAGKNLIRDTKLFHALNAEQFDAMLHDLQIRKYPAHKIIFREGEIADGLFIIQKGSVRIYTCNKEGEKIPLSRLNEGGYFGEEALLGTASKSRSANIETMKPSVLLKINQKYISYALQRDESLREKLLKLGYEQALKLLSATTNINKDIQKFISEIKNPNIITVNKDDIIFNIGDVADNVYIILKGIVEIRIFNNNDGKYNRSIIPAGYLFGELGVVKNAVRSATAVAQSTCNLLVIKGDDFKKYLAEFGYLNNVLASLEKIYQLPKKGYIEQNFGYVKNFGETINNIYNLHDGRIVICSQFVNSDIFRMHTLNVESEKHIEYKTKSKKITLDLTDNQLVAVTAFGHFEILPELCHILLNKQKVDQSYLTQFAKTGEIHSLRKINISNEIVCVCMSVTRKTLQDLIDQGISTYEGLRDATGASTSCGACTYKVKEMVGYHSWMPAIMQKTIDHNDVIKSYVIKLNKSKFETYKPGQYIILQMLIDNYWIERPITICDFISTDCVRVTIKLYKDGLMSQFLSNLNNMELNINVTQPQGNFLFDSNTNNSTLCIAGGIGITPMLAFAKHISATNKNRLQIIYQASSQKDFVYVDEFHAVTEKNSTFSIHYRQTATQGKINQIDLMKAIEDLENPDIFICGPAGFVTFVQSLLKPTHIDTKKIRIEKFVHAGSKQI